MEKPFKINEVARLLCTTPDAIRLYERKKIVQPSRDADNQYRAFTQEDIARLYDCRLLQNFGFSLTEIAEIIADSNQEHFYQRFDEQVHKLEQEVVRYNRALIQMRRIRDVQQMVDYNHGRFFICDSPHVLVLCYSDIIEFGKQKSSNFFYQQVATHHNLFRRCAIIHEDQVFSHTHGSYTTLGYSIELNHAEEIGLYAQGDVAERKPQRSVYTVIEASGPLTPQHLQPVYDWMDDHGLELDGDVFLWILKFYFDQEATTYFYSVWAPIKE